MWSSAAASWINLQPAASYYSSARGISGGQQVGFTDGGGGRGGTRASLWSGLPDSWVNLNPAGANVSAAYGIDAGQQVGLVNVSGVPHASLWKGSAESWLDLNPVGADTSAALGVHGGQQVGYTYALVGGTRASLWSGTALSWVDLHAFLSSDFTESLARGIWHDETFTYVVGYGYNSTTTRYEALMWVGPLPCTADFNHDGAVNSQDYFDFLTAFFALDPAADFNHSGSVDSQDFFDFLATFFAPC
jgi:hypothetical protein